MAARRKKRRQALVFAMLVGLGVVWAPAALADEPAPPSSSDYGEMDLQQLLSRVVTATKRDQALEEAPATVAVVTCTEIRARGYRSVAEAIRAIPGLALIDDHTHQHIGVRGFFSEFETPNDIIQVMVNGQPVSFRPLGGGFLGTELIPIEAVKRIEVLRGPGSALYGAHAFLGVINVITFDGSEDLDGRPSDDEGPPGTHHAASVELSYRASAHDQYPGVGASAVSGGSWGPFRYFVAGSFHRWDRSGLRLPGLEDALVGRRYLDEGGATEMPAGYPSPGWDPAGRERLLRSSPSAGDIGQTGSFFGATSWSFGPSAGRIALDSSLQYVDRGGEFQEYSALTHENRLTYLNWFLRLRYLLEPEREGPGVTASIAVAGGEPVADRLVDPLSPGAYKRRDFGYLAVDAVLEASYVFGPMGCRVPSGPARAGLRGRPGWRAPRGRRPLRAAACR